MIDENHNPWQTLSSERKYESPWITVTEHQIINPSGTKGIYGCVNFKNLAIGIIPLDKDLNTWIVGQYRYPLSTYSWEIPEGGGKKELSPLISAQRELKEECGIIAQKWTKIHEFNTSNSCTDEHAIIFVAQQLEFHQAEPEETEQLQVKKIPFKTLYQMVIANEIMDSLTIIAVLKLNYLLEKRLLK